MSKSIFVTGTGTDVGKTYVTALIVKKFRESGLNAGYYKAALSGAEMINNKLVAGDADYVNTVSRINEKPNDMVSYIYRNAVSPHLASKIEGNPVDINKVVEDYKDMCERFDYVTMEGSGGIVCPIRYDENSKIFLEDIIKKLELSTIIVADAGLGTINSIVLTVEYMRSHNIKIKGIILNNYTGGIMQEDNKKMVEEITNIPVIVSVKPYEKNLEIDVDTLKDIYE